MDILRTVQLSPGGRPVQRVNLADPAGLTVYTERSTFSIAPPAKAQNWSRSPRRFAGSVQSGESHDNWTALASWWVKGSSPDQVLANAETLMAEVDDASGLIPSQPKLIEWRPDGASASVFMELRGTGVYTPRYEWAAFTGVPMLKIDMSWPIAPLMRGLPLDIIDPFDVDSTGDYAMDSGAALTFNSGSPFGSIAPASLAADWTVRHTIRGYQYGDLQTIVGYHVGATAPTSLGATGSIIDANNFLEARWSSTTLGIYKKDGGAFTTLNSAVVTAVGTNTNCWIVLRKEGNLVTAEIWLSPPSPLSTPTSTLSYTLVGGDATKYGIGGRGWAGWRTQNLTTDSNISYFEAKPYVYSAHQLPCLFTAPAVPGTGAPLADLQITSGGVPLTGPVGLSPNANPAGSGGTFAGTGSVSYLISALTAFGETGLSGSGSSTITLTATTQTVSLAWTPPRGASGIRIYRSDPGTTTPLKLIAEFDNQRVTSYTDTGTAGNASITPPATSTAYTATPQWGLVAWSRRPTTHNYIWNGDLDVDADGWYATGDPTNSLGNATSIGRLTTQPDAGTGHGQITFTSFANSAGHFRIYRRLRAGVTYTATARLASPSLTDGAKLMIAAFGNDNAIYQASGSTVNLAAGYQSYLVTFTPPVDCDYVSFGIVHTAATGGQAYFDRAQFFEGTVAPTIVSQVQGRGAAPPFGILDGGGVKPGDTVAVNCTVLNQPGTVSAGGAINNPQQSIIIQATTGAGGSALVDWWIDPHLMATPDDFAQGTIAIEIFWRGTCPPSVQNGSGQNWIINPRIVISAITDPTAGSVMERFTQEFGTAGRQLVQKAISSTVVSAGRMSRLGTLILPINPAVPVRWKLKAMHVWSAAITTVSGVSSGFATDYLMCVPARRRASGPTGKSRTDGTYPAWQQLAPSGQAIKTIRSDLRGRIALPTSLPLYDAEDTGLSGSPIELQPPPPAGAPGGGVTQDQQFMVKLSSLVPDDPSAEDGESLLHPATVHFAITPRYRLARGAGM